MSPSALLFDKLGYSACCHWTTENVDHILEFGDKMNFRFFAGRTYTRYRNTFHNDKQSPFRCTLDCREQQSGRLAATLTANFTAKLTVKISRNRRKKSREITAKSGNFTAKLTLKIPRNLSFFPRNTRRSDISVKHQPRGPACRLLTNNHVNAWTRLM